MRKTDSVILATFLLISAALHAGCGGPAQNEPAQIRPAGTSTNISETKEQSANPAGKALIWKIESLENPTRTFFVLGSIHAANADFYPLDPAIEEAYKESGSLLVEVNLAALPQEKMTEIVLSRAMPPPGQILSEKVQAGVWEKLKAVLDKYHVPMDTMMRFKPWFAALTLVTLRVASDGYNPAFGIDQYFINKGDKEILELESADSQLALFDELPPNLEELLLLDAIEGNLQAGGELEKIMNAWIEGDADKLNELIFGTVSQRPEFEPLFKKLIVDRNYAMADRIEKLLEQGKKIFAVIGAGHLVGEEGIVAIFKSKGFKTEQLKKSNSL